MKRLALLLLTMLPLIARAGDKVGTSGAQFLKIGAGARPTAMGDAFVGVADDVNAVYFNPAGLAFLEKKEGLAMRTQYFQGLDYNFGAYAHPMERGGTWAISAATLQTDEITARGLDEGDTGTFENQDAGYALSYGRKFGDTLAGGLTARWIREEIAGAAASAWTGDVGVYKRFENRPFTLGLAIRHFGQEVKFDEEGDPLPLTIDGGGAIRFCEDRLMLAVNVKDMRDTGVKFGAGLEWRNSLFGKVRYSARGGFNSANTDASDANGFAFGAGLGYQLLDFDFAWVPFGDLGNTFRYAARLKF